MATARKPASKLTQPAAPAKKPAAPRRRAAAQTIPAAKPRPDIDTPVDDDEASGGAKGLLRAGLKALGTVRDDVVKRQTHVIESLLGGKSIDPGASALGFGFRKFEDVFDQRVATALERLGMPSAQEIQALRDEVRQLRAQLAQESPGAQRKKR